MILPFFHNLNSNNYHRFSRLQYYTSLPNYLKWNSHIKSGYRNSYTYYECLKSIFQFSNESINIWSHLIGFFIFLYLLIIDIFVFLPTKNGNYLDYIVISFGLLCFMVCMLSSVLYHLFSCHSEKINRFFLSIDMMGICIGLIGCYLPGIYYAFYCFMGWGKFYTFLIFCLTIAVLVVQLRPAEMENDNFSARIFIFLLLAIFGFVPTLHWIFLNKGFSTDIVAIFLIKVIRLYTLGAISFIIYFFQIPERFWPGRFDFIGSSHQIWHVLILICFYDWHSSGVEFFHYRLDHVCFNLNLH